MAPVPYGSGGSLRIKKTDSDVSTRYYTYQGNSPLVEYDSNGSVKKKYVYAPSAALGAGLGQCIAYLDNSGYKHYLHHDALGSVRVTQTSPV